MICPGISRTPGRKGRILSRYPVNFPIELHQEAARLAARQGISLNQFILWSVAEKVGELRANLDDPSFPGITYRRGASGRPSPVVRGTGVRVQTIVSASQHWQLSPDEIASEFGLNTRQVRECLAFHDAHSAEIEASMDAESKVAEARA